MRIGFILAFAAGTALAQNSDLGMLIGISGPSSQVVAGSQTRITGSVGASGQINYARQLKEYRAGRLYLELPLLIGARSIGSVGAVITGFQQTGVYFTPGVRFNVTLDPRISFYAAGGAGLASFRDSRATVGPGFVSASVGWESSLAAAFGGGLDFRLTRLISLRAEARDFVSRRGIGLTDGRHHAVYGFGMGFHW